MCGIFCALSKSNGEGEKYAHTLLDYCSHNLQRRGPDHFQTMPIELPFGYNLLLAASVLQTQGEHLCTQPCIEKENVLCWNGDVFGGLMVDEIKSSKLSDTKIISKNLSSSLSRSENPAQILNEIVGPYSFIFYNRKTQTLWFGRDPAGRHSLLYGFSESPFAIVLSSVAHTSLDQIQELPALGIYEIDAKLLNDPADLLVYLHPWGEIDTEELNEVIRSFPFNIHIRSRICNQYIFKPSPFMFSKSDVDIMNLFSNIPQGLSTEDKIIHFLSVETFNKNMMKVLSLLEASVQVRSSI